MRKKRSLKRKFAIILLCLGLLLTALNLYGNLRPAVVAIVPEHQTPVSGYHSRKASIQSARLKAESLAKFTNLHPLKKLTLLFEYVSDSFVHLPEAYQIDLADNWHLWLRGHGSEKYRDSQDPDFLWRRGGGFCHQAAIVFSGQAQKLGFDARILWLDGHVISEVEVPDSGWLAFDPDLGIAWESSYQQLLDESDANFIRQRIMDRGFNYTFAEKLTKIYLSDSRKRRTHLPYLPELYASEQAAATTRWLVPALAIFIGIVGLL